MSNPGKFARSVQLLQLSLRVIAKNKKLLFFPPASFVFVLLIVVVFFASTVLQPTGYSWGQFDHWGALAHRFKAALHPWSADDHAGFQWAGCVRLVALYLSSMVCVTFLNVAFYHEIIQAMAGEIVSLRRGLVFASRRFRAILAWSLFAGSIGVLIRFLSDRFDGVGKFAFGLVGFTWSVAATFVIPIIVRHESSNPIFLLRNSAGTIRRTWGESLIGYAGVQLLSVIICMTSVILMFYFFPEHLTHDNIPYIVGAGLLVFIACTATAVLANMADSIFLCALYVYASEGVVPEPYSSEMMDAAWNVRVGSQLHGPSPHH